MSAQIDRFGVYLSSNQVRFMDASEFLVVQVLYAIPEVWKGKNRRIPQRSGLNDERIEENCYRLWGNRYQSDDDSTTRPSMLYQ